jgi:hypothetical protein
MPKHAQPLHYFIERYVRCGEMPLFLIFCRDRGGWKRYCVMLCNIRNLRQMVRLRRGFENPKDYGRVLCTGEGSEPSEMIREMLKARYDFDLNNNSASEIRLF